MSVEPAPASPAPQGEEHASLTSFDGPPGTYDLAEHAYPVELDTLADLFEGISAANTISFAGAEAFRDSEASNENHNGGNMSAVLNATEISWGDIALLLSVPRQGLV